MQLLLLKAGLGLLWALGAQGSEESQSQGVKMEEATFSPKQLLGKWYIHRWAGTIPFHPEKRKQPLPPFFFVINGIGVLEFRMRIRKPSGCHLLKLPFKLLEPGQYATWWRHPIHVWKMDEGHSGVAYFKDQMNSQLMKMTMLFARSPEEDPNTVERFAMVVEAFGLKRRDIVKPPLTDACELSQEA